MSPMTERYQKATALYDHYERKGEGAFCTHYCPGCGHGTIQKLIADAIDALGIQDRTIFLSPVGCSVFSYYYFDTGNIQCSHGRAPAVATGVKRSVRDAIVISYQGDGDLAGIGMTEIMHAANRGEPITVFFINNAIYGMTGGQMAPTTPLGQKTLTSPFGRDFDRDGNPIGMVEVMDSLTAPVYLERCAVSTPKEVLRTRKAVEKALQNQVDGLGFSFVEILSPCPTNWRMSPVDARAWIAKEMVKQYPVRVFRDRLDHEDKKRPKTVKPSFMADRELIELLSGDATVPEISREGLSEAQLIRIAGFGGQGVLSAGELIATCGMSEHLEVSWLPSYGPEMRGGSANVSVIIDNEEIGSPVIDHPNVLIAMNGPSLDLFEPQVVSGGTIIVNTSIIERKIQRSDVTVLYVPATELARDMGLQSAANVVMVSAYALLSGVFPVAVIEKCLPLVLRRAEFLERNLQIVKQTVSYLKEKL